MFGFIVAPQVMAIADYASRINRSNADLAMAFVPGHGLILEGATLSRAARGLSAAAIYEKAGGFAQATKDFEALGGAEKIIGPVKLKELLDGSKAVLRNFSKDGRATLEIQETSGAVTKKRYNGTTSQGAAPLEIPARPLGELNQGIISCAGI